MRGVTLRRFLVFQSFLLWQGGFLFYATVVVPIGSEFLQSATLQGLITQRVTHWLNLFGLAWAILFAWDVAAGRDPERRRRIARWAGWGACVALLGLVVVLHRELDALIDLEAERVTDKKIFKALHIGYLWAVTIHWAVAVGLAWLTLRAWAAEDRATAVSPAPAASSGGA